MNTDPRTDAARPLADALRPRSIDGIIGQEHLLGPGMPLRHALESGRPHSMILWGPPGVGKTTLGRLFADAAGCAFIALSAVMADARAFAAALAQAEHEHAAGRRTILFVDEIHLLGKARQEALLAVLKSGAAILVGATTENPSFALMPALQSRCRVHVLKSLGDADMLRLLARAQAHTPDQAPLEDAARAALAAYADGDARRCLNLLEQLRSAAGAAGLTHITAAFVQDALTGQSRRFDKGGEYFYDQISALHKSVRGSHPDAALYWLCRMLDGGVDRKYLVRRILAIAYDDIGLADPAALRLAQDAATSYERLGAPEGELALAQAVLYLAATAKSNAGTLAYGQARAFVRADGPRPVPAQLRHAQTGREEKRQDHNGPDGYAAGERYLPDGMAEPGWYAPAPRGLEARIGDRLARLRALDEEARRTQAGGIAARRPR